MLESERPRDSFSWIIGSDILPTFNLWNEWQSLVRDHNLIVFPRDTDFRTLEERVMRSFHLTEIPENITVVEGDLVVSNVASTHVRKRVRARQPVMPLVLPEVARYIEENKLYVS
jgi:nicotinate-nucleotide adenylyltransferase